jgi:uncharacterized protein
MPDLGKMAFDGSVRTFDTDGRLHLAKSHISKATVNPYYGMEIPGYERLGLDPTHVYYLFRDPVELARSASTFARLPVLSRHVPVSAEAPRQDLIVGSIGSDVEFNDPYLDADVSIWDATAIAGIETDTVREFSCAYHYAPVMTPGEYHGQRYDGIMTEIRGNHLALVESGRAGSDVLAADEDITIMKTTKLGKALFVILGGMSPKLAADSALLALVGQASKKTFKADEVSSKLIALDADLDPKKLKIAFDAMLALDAEDPDKKPKVAEDDDDEEDDDDAAPAQDADESDEDYKKRCAKDKIARDKMAKDAEEKQKTAMDSYRKELRDADEARRLVRDVVGDVIAQDTAAGIFTLALDEMKVGHEGVTDPTALKALFTLANSQRSAAPAPRIAQDSASVTAKFPQATRFRQQ